MHAVDPRRWMSHVILHITERCNLRCRTCFVKKGARDLPLADAEAIARKLGRVAWLDLGGGEPFLHPDLIAICKAFRCQSITIPTNGQEPDAVVAAVRRLRAEVSGELTVAVSLDGFEAANDAIRGAGAYSKALTALAGLREVAGVVVKVNTVICAENAGQLTQFVRFVHTLNPDYHSLLLLRGTPQDPVMALPDLAQLRRELPEILKVLRMYSFASSRNPLIHRMKVNYQRYLLDVSLRTLEESRCFVPCKAPHLHKVIYVDGSTSMCELMPAVGNILTEEVAAIEAKMRAALRRYEEANGPCYCTHNCNLGENIMTHPGSVWRVLRGGWHG